jgi:hypothetical protein
MFTLRQWNRAGLCLAAIASLVTTQAIAGPFTSLEYDFDWRSLDPYQRSLTRAEFEKKLAMMSPDGSMGDYLVYNGDRSVTVIGGNPDQSTDASWTLHFARDKEEIQSSLPYAFDQDWLDELIEQDRELPLSGLTICLDPGHIGGEWASIEERYFRIGRYAPVKEGGSDPYDHGASGPTTRESRGHHRLDQPRVRASDPDTAGRPGTRGIAFHA